MTEFDAGASNSAVVNQLVSGVPASFSLPQSTGLSLFNGSLGFQIVAPAGSTTLQINSVTATTGVDVDLWVRFGQDVAIDANGLPVADYLAQALSGSQTLLITTGSTPPLKAGTYYIGFAVYNPVAVSGTITATLGSAPNPATPPPTVYAWQSDWNAYGAAMASFLQTFPFSGTGASITTKFAGKQVSWSGTISANPGPIPGEVQVTMPSAPIGLSNGAAGSLSVVNLYPAASATAAWSPQAMPEGTSITFQATLGNNPIGNDDFVFLSFLGQVDAYVQAYNALAPCSFALTPGALSPTALGGSFNFAIQTGSSCGWTVLNLPAWIAISGSASGTGSGNVTLVVAANPAGSRSAAITIAGISVQVNQASAPCTYSLSGGGQAFPAAGGSGSVGVVAPSWCAWTASSSQNWVTITGGFSGVGNGQTTYQAPANLSGARSGNLTIAGIPFTVQQAGATQLSFAGSMAQIASAGGWDTQLTLVNLGAAQGEARVNFYGDDGSALTLPFTFPQQPSLGTILGSTLDESLGAGATQLLDTAGPASQANLEGSAQLLTGGTVGGFAIFDYLPTGQQAAVPLETRNASSYLLAFDYTGGKQTGLALANLSAQAGNVGVVVRDDSGLTIPTNVLSIPLAGSGHTSFMLNDASQGFPEIAGKRGTVEFDTPSGGQIAVLGLRANGAALTTLPVLAQVDASGGALAQVATGGGWETGFTLVNTGSTAASFTLNFYDQNTGAALPLNLVFPQTGATQSTSSVTDTLAGGASLLIQTQGGATNIACSAQLSATGPVSGFAIFQYLPTAQEAVVPLEIRTPQAFVLAYDNTNGLATGLALANVSAQASTVPVVVRDDTGATLAQSQIPLAGNGHTQFMLTDSVLGFPATANKRGTIEFDTPSGGRISALGIRATAQNVILTIPVLAK